MNTKNDSVSEQQKNLQIATYILQFSKKSVHFVSTRAHLRASRRDETLTFLGTLRDASRILLTFVGCQEPIFEDFLIQKDKYVLSFFARPA